LEDAGVALDLLPAPDTLEALLLEKAQVCSVFCAR
jgi:hypothetical protein